MKFLEVIEASEVILFFSIFTIALCLWVFHFPNND
jgi:hypothetical protein